MDMNRLEEWPMDKNGVKGLVDYIEANGDTYVMYKAQGTARTMKDLVINEMVARNVLKKWQITVASNSRSLYLRRSKRKVASWITRNLHEYGNSVLPVTDVKAFGKANLEQLLEQEVGERVFIRETDGKTLDEMGHWTKGQKGYIAETERIKNEHERWLHKDNNGRSGRN